MPLPYGPFLGRPVLKQTSFTRPRHCLRTSFGNSRMKTHGEGNFDFRNSEAGMLLESQIKHIHIFPRSSSLTTGRTPRLT